MEKHTNTAPRPETVPVYVYDDAVVRAAHQIKIHWRMHFVMLAVIVAIVVGFLIYLNQYEYVSNDEVLVDGANGVANYVGKDGNIYNGPNSSCEDPLQEEEAGEAQGNT